jgi:hypothetical protein
MSTVLTVCEIAALMAATWWLLEKAFSDHVGRMAVFEGMRANAREQAEVLEHQRKMRGMIEEATRNTLEAQRRSIKKEPWESD